jgi:nicotinamidase-related amidase
LIRELARETKGVPQHLRISASPFLDETTRAAIAKSGRQHLIVGGFATEVLVLHAACDAIAAGYEVHASKQRLHCSAADFGDIGEMTNKRCAAHFQFAS